MTYLSPNQRLYVLMANVSIFLLIFGPFLIGFGIYCNQRDSASLKWPATPGKIVKYDKTWRSGRHARYEYTATYVYTVNGNQYAGQRYAVWDNYVTERWGNYWVDHPVSSSVDVYYDPQNPQSTVLFRGPEYWVNENCICMGAAFIAFAIFLRIKMRKFRAAGNAPYGKAL